MLYYQKARYSQNASNTLGKHQTHPQRRITIATRVAETVKPAWAAALPFQVQ